MKKLILTLILSALLFGCSDDEGLSIEEQKAINAPLVGWWQLEGDSNEYCEFTDDFVLNDHIGRNLPPYSSWNYSVSLDGEFIRIDAMQYIEELGQYSFIVFFLKIVDEEWLARPKLYFYNYNEEQELTATGNAWSKMPW